MDIQKKLYAAEVFYNTERNRHVMTFKDADTGIQRGYPILDNASTDELVLIEASLALVFWEDRNTFIRERQAQQAPQQQTKTGTLQQVLEE